jgi:PTH1 family peptidyl-tRNA hydrolase
MGLFVRKSNTNNEPVLYSISASKTVIIVGLGNPGEKYHGTRHNIGFACVDAFAKDHAFPAWSTKKSLKAQATSLTINGTRVILIKPQTFMNDSGESVKAAQQFYKVSSPATVVVHDELDLPFGTIKTKQGGGSAGHNGLKSIIAHCGEEFGRVRVGIGNEFSPKADSADFVLGKFTKTEQGAIKQVTNTVRGLLNDFVTNGVVTAATTVI